MRASVQAFAEMATPPGTATDSSRAAMFTSSPEQIVLVGHYVPHVDAQTKLHDPVRRELLVPFGHQRLHRDRRLDGAYNARKFQHETVAGVLHEPAAMIENDWVHRAPMGLERGMGTCFVGAHQSRVARDVGADYGG